MFIVVAGTCSSLVSSDPPSHCSPLCLSQSDYQLHYLFSIQSS